jgi:hypothetical protein
VLVDQSVLAPDAPFLMEELVPGALCDLAVENSSCIKIVGSYRLQQLAVTFGDTEQVALTFQPPGTL